MFFWETSFHLFRQVRQTKHVSVSAIQAVKVLVLSESQRESACVVGDAPEVLLCYSLVQLLRLMLDLAYSYTLDYILIHSSG